MRLTGRLRGGEGREGAQINLSSAGRADTKFDLLLMVIICCGQPVCGCGGIAIGIVLMDW